MSDLPVLFSTPMVLSLLAERKTQTRRVLKSGPERLMCRACGCSEREWKSGKCRCGDGKGDLQWTPCDLPRYRVGDRLYVREEIRKWGAGYVKYTADDKETFIFWPTRWQRDMAPGMHMPKTMSRLTLEVTGVRVQRLQDITEDDAADEGVVRVRLGDMRANMDRATLVGSLGRDDDEAFWLATEESSSFWNRAVDAYRDLWDSINGERNGGEYLWQANPWVACYSFSVYKKNIDRL